MLSIRILDLIVLTGSFIFGLVMVYTLSGGSVRERSMRANVLINHVLNAILYIWGSKILLHLSDFFHNPVVVFSYPTESEAIYLGLFVMIISHIVMRKTFKIIELKELFSVGLFASFFYEFVQVIVYKNSEQFFYLVFMSLFLLAELWLVNYLPSKWSFVMRSSTWMFGLLVFSRLVPSFTLLGYLIKPFYTMLLFLLIAGWGYYVKSRNDTN